MCSAGYGGVKSKSKYTRPSAMACGVLSSGSTQQRPGAVAVREQHTAFDGIEPEHGFHMGVRTTCEEGEADFIAFAVDRPEVIALHLAWAGTAGLDRGLVHGLDARGANRCHLLDAGRRWRQLREFSVSDVVTGRGCPRLALRQSVGGHAQSASFEKPTTRIPGRRSWSIAGASKPSSIRYWCFNCAEPCRRAGWIWPYSRGS